PHAGSNLPVSRRRDRPADRDSGRERDDACDCLAEEPHAFRTAARPRRRRTIPAGSNLTSGRERTLADDPVGAMSPTPLDPRAACCAHPPFRRRYRLTGRTDRRVVRRLAASGTTDLQGRGETGWPLWDCVPEHRSAAGRTPRSLSEITERLAALCRTVRNAWAARAPCRRHGLPAFLEKNKK